LIYLCFNFNIRALVNFIFVNQLRIKFNSTTAFTRTQLYEFFRELDPEVKEITIRWRIYNLKENGIIRAIDKTWFSLAILPPFLPVQENRQKEIYRRVTKEFPGIKACIWTTKWIHEFMLHQPGRSFSILEVEKGSEEIVFNHLSDNRIRNILLRPDPDQLDKYISPNSDTVVVRSLISKSPVQKLCTCTVPLIEKILVDLFANPKLFTLFQGSELEFIYSSVLEKYSVNETRMLNYAARRGKKQDLAVFLQQLSTPSNSNL
jgi:hypothetical protein